MLGIAVLQPGHDSDGLHVVVEPAEVGHLAMQYAFAGVAKRCVAEVMSERHRLGQILIEPQRPSERASHLADFQRVGQTRPEMLALVMQEDLGLVLEAAKGGRMDDAVPVALELGAGWAAGHRVQPAARGSRIGGIGRLFAHSALSIGSQRYYIEDMTEAALASNPVILTDRAAKKIGRVLSKQAPGTVLRIVVAGGGCSGFQYEYKLVQETPANDDLVLAKDAATVLIDSLSLEFMGGAEIDYVDDLIGQSFQIRNPNAVASCGCGTSFSVAV